MKVLVSFKSVPDPYAGLGDSASKSVINPFDEIAIEEALRIRERGEATEIVGVTIAATAADEQIRAALAMGVDRAIRIDDARALDPYAVARILRALVAKEAPQIVLMGKQAVDDDSNQVGQMLAGLLGWPQATFISKIECDSVSTSPWMRSMKSAMRSTMVSISPISTAVPVVRLGSGLRQRAAKMEKACGSA